MKRLRLKSHTFCSMKRRLWFNSLRKNRKRSNRSKARNKVDHISNLPDPILHLILSRLDSSEEVIRSSILATRWRYLWTSVPSLNINFTRKVKEPYTLLHKNEFKEFVDRVLANRTLVLDSFALKCPVQYDMSTIGHWIELVVMRKVKQLELAIGVTDDVVLPRCLVDCDSLEVLKLDFSGSSLRLERFTGSKTLKIFKLGNVELLDHDLVHSFLSNCPSLEELRLIDCSTKNLDYLVISCPNLKTLIIYHQGLYEEASLCKSLKLLCPKLVYLEYSGYMATHFSFDVKSLKKAVIEVKFWQFTNELKDEILCASMCELFAQVPHVEYLSINWDFIKAVENFDLPDFFPPLPNLKTLEIELTWCSTEEFIYLLQCSPNLESLHMIIINDEDWNGPNFDDDADEFIEDLDEVETGTLALHLKRVELSKFNREKVSLAIARFLLEHGHGLEEMVFSWSNKDKYDTQSMINMNEVSNFYKASSSVKVINLLKESSEK